MLRFGYSIIVVMGLVLGTVLTGCGGNPAQQAIENATGAKVEQKGDSVTIKTDQGETNISSNVPDELKDFPVPSGFKSEGGGTMSSQGEKLAAISWTGKSNLKDVGDFYKKTMPEKGWTEDSSFDMDSGIMRNYTKGDFSVTLTVDQEGDKTTIAVLGSTVKATPTAAAKAATPTKAASDTAKATATSGKPAATATPAAPQTADMSTVAKEITDMVPIPSGFQPVKGSTSRMATGGKFALASAEFYGTGKMDQLEKTLQTSITSKGWKELMFTTGDEEIMGMYEMTKDGVTYNLTVAAEPDDPGISLTIQVYVPQ